MDDPSKWVYEDDRYDTERHEAERSVSGFSTYDWWNFCDYIAWVNIQALEKFKTGHGFPSDLADVEYGGDGSGMEGWVTELDCMIDGFKAHLEIQNNWPLDDPEAQARLKTTFEEGMALYAKRFQSLWD